MGSQRCAYLHENNAVSREHFQPALCSHTICTRSPVLHSTLVTAMSHACPCSAAPCPQPRACTLSIAACSRSGMLPRAHSSETCGLGSLWKSCRLCSENALSTRLMARQTCSTTPHHGYANYTTECDTQKTMWGTFSRPDATARARKDRVWSSFSKRSRAPKLSWKLRGCHQGMSMNLPHQQPLCISRLSLSCSLRLSVGYSRLWSKNVHILCHLSCHLVVLAKQVLSSATRC